MSENWVSQKNTRTYNLAVMWFITIYIQEMYKPAKGMSETTLK